MTHEELETEVMRREAEGRDHMVLVIARSKEPEGRRVRVLPGVMGTYVGCANTPGCYVVDVMVADLRRYLRLVGCSVET